MAGAFLAAYAAILLLMLGVVAAGAALTNDPGAAADGAFALALRDLRADAAGRLSLEADGELRALRARHPGLWLFARSERSEIAAGPVPAEVLALARAAPMSAYDSVEMVAPGRDAAGLLTGLAMEGAMVEGHRVIMGVGGVRAEEAAVRGALLYFHHIGLGWFVLGLLGLSGLAVLVTAPLSLRSVRPLAAAAERLDPQDVSRRLPEERTPRELLPVTRAFNAALDRVEEALERRRRFMADVAHEFRTPLAVLTLQVDGLAEGPAKTDMRRGLHRLSQMVGQMLDAERLGGPGRRREVLDLVAMCREAAADAAPLAVDAGYELHVDAPADPVPALGDAPALKRAVANLLGNAVAHGGGSGTITVRVTPEPAVEVFDEGPGVPPELRDRVFDPFHRGRPDRDGCGLGLHLTAEIMRAHGGRAELADSSDPSGGASFRLVFAKGASG